MKIIKTILTCGSLLCFSMATHAADVASVNGKGISQTDYENFLKYRVPRNKDGSVNAPREQVINEMVNRELLYQEAVKQGIDKDPAVVFQLKQMRIDALIQATVSKRMQASPITELELKNEYEKRKKAFNQKEYNASHILVKSEDEAKAIIKQLDSGAKFEELAKTKSIGPSNKNGGKLGWFNPAQMDPAFSKATIALKKGKYSSKPVKSSFGWHVILLHDMRAMKAPEFAQVKKQLYGALQNQRLQAYVKELRSKAKLDIKK